MDIQIDWQEPIQLTRFKKIIIEKNDLPDSIENVPGVYFFSRKFGKSYLPFYIGETTALRGRLKNHLAWSDLVDVLRGFNGGDKTIKNGDRYFHYGYFIAKQAQNAKTCCQIVQKYLVREAMAQNIPLLNKKLTGFQTDTISFRGSHKARGIYEKLARVES